MRWEEAEVESVLETIWDLHDKVSDAIHAISRAHFLRSVRAAAAVAEGGESAAGIASGGEGGRSGFVFVKGFDAAGAGAATADGGLAEARSLHAIRSALEDLEDQLEFFHTVQSQQLAERNAAVARLEQSRIILAMRLAEHEGKKYPVIEEAMEFIGTVHGKGRFVSPEDVYRVPPNQAIEVEDQGDRRPTAIMRMLSFGYSFAKNSLKLDALSGTFGNAALVAFSMLAILQLNQVASRSDNGSLQTRFTKPLDNSIPRSDCPLVINGKLSRLDVLLGRG